jgi:nucleotide-binding universal stress UspA family protein
MKEAMRVLLAVDGSDCSIAVMDEAARLPWPKDSYLKVLTVVEMPASVSADPFAAVGDNYTAWAKALEEQAAANTAKALARYYERSNEQIEVTARAVKGDAKETIIDEAERWGADLIMVGTHGYNPLERLWLGSVSRAVTSHARCSVEVVRKREAHNDQKLSPMKILLAVDGSSCSEEAVTEIAERPWPAGSEVRVVSAIHLTFTPTPETHSFPYSYYSQVEKAGREQAEVAISSALALLRRSNAGRIAPLILTDDFFLGRAEDVIMTVAKEWNADLIMLGSHGYRGWKRFLLGSVAQAVAWHAPCSVQIVRGDQRTAKRRLS